MLVILLKYSFLLLLKEEQRKINFFLFQDRYDVAFQARIDECPVITVSDLAQLKPNLKCAQIHYSNEKEFVAIADVLSIMNDFKVRYSMTFSYTDISCSIRFL